MNLKGKKIWITGASSGIGEALAYAFAREGAQLILSARNEKELERVKNNCTTPPSVKVLPLDIGDHDAIFVKAEKLIKEIGAIDVLINNAGLSQRSLAKDTDLSVTKRLLDVDLTGTIALTKAVLEPMIQQKSGQIIVVTSIMGKLGAPLRSSYAAAKHGLHGYFDTLRSELYDDGIRVLLVCPGYVRTNISINALVADGKNQGTMDEATEKGFTPEEVAAKIMKAMKNGKEEIVIAKGKVLLATYLKRFAPRLLSRMTRNAKTT
ncbi:MAG: SDR family oxidoreductase [Saprospiraceae bacterium]|nr:SDR family oxidoreductase [Saprospiraceae bacterium]